MATTLDLAAIGASAAVLAYQLICLQSEQRELREAVNARLASLDPTRSILSEDTIDQLKFQLASAVADQLGRVAPPAPAATPQPQIQAAVAAIPTPASTGLPDGLTPAQARKELEAELEAMKADDIRSRVRQLPADQRETFKRYIPSLDKARKDQLITGMLRTFGL